MLSPRSGRKPGVALPVFMIIYQSFMFISLNLALESLIFETCSSCSEFIFPSHEKIHQVSSYLGSLRGWGFNRSLVPWQLQTFTDPKNPFARNMSKAMTNLQADPRWVGRGYQISYLRCQDVAIVVELHCPSQNGTRNCILNIGVVVVVVDLNSSFLHSLPLWAMLPSSTSESRLWTFALPIIENWRMSSQKIYSHLFISPLRLELQLSLPLLNVFNVHQWSIHRQLISNSHQRTQKSLHPLWMNPSVPRLWMYLWNSSIFVRWEPWNAVLAVSYVIPLLWPHRRLAQILFALVHGPKIQARCSFFQSEGTFLKLFWIKSVFILIMQPPLPSFLLSWHCGRGSQCRGCCFYCCCCCCCCGLLCLFALVVLVAATTPQKRYDSRERRRRPPEPERINAWGQLVLPQKLSGNAAVLMTTVRLYTRDGWFPFTVQKPGELYWRHPKRIL